MKLKALNYIHSLLIEREAATQKAVEMVKEAMDKADEDGAENYNSLCAAHSRAEASWREALDALSEFEDQEW